MKDLLLLYLVTINAAGFVLMLADKHKAKKKLWRIPEATLMTVAALGGSVGSWVCTQCATRRSIPNSPSESRCFWRFRSSPPSW